MFRPPRPVSMPLTLAPMVDGVLCSFKALTSRRAAVANSLSTLRRLGARTLGVALTGVNPRYNGFAGTAKALKDYKRANRVGEPPEVE